jgi:RNA polymerase sigma factor (sigma-70 family)
MKLPVNMTEAETLKIIDKVLRKFAKKYAFGLYDHDDIYQEGFMLAMQALEVYDGDSPLENFLSVHIKNRLISLKRSKFSRKDICNSCTKFDENCPKCIKRQATYSAKKNLNQPIDILSVNPEGEKNLCQANNSDVSLETSELLSLINKYLPLKYREDYLKMRDGVYIHKSLRDEIEAIVLNIIEQHDK